jgi:hypothetical protein
MRMSMTSQAASGGAAFNPADFGTARGWWEADNYAANTAANKIVTGSPWGAMSLEAGTPTVNATGWGSTPTVDFDRASTDAVRAACSTSSGTRFVLVNVMDVTSVTHVGGTSIFFSFADVFFQQMQGVVSTFADGIESSIYNMFSTTNSGVRIATGKQVWILDKYANGTPTVLYINGVARVSVNNSAIGDRYMNYLYIGSTGGAEAGAQRWKAGVAYDGGLSTTIAALNTAVSTYYGV